MTSSIFTHHLFCSYKQNCSIYLFSDVTCNIKIRCLTSQPSSHLSVHLFIHLFFSSSSAPSISPSIYSFLRGSLFPAMHSFWYLSTQPSTIYLFIFHSFFYLSSISSIYQIYTSLHSSLSPLSRYIPL